MPTTGTVLAKAMKIYTGGTPAAVTCQTNGSISLNTAMFDTTCKDSGAWAENRPGTKSWTASGEGLLAFDATNGFSQLFTAWSAQTEVDVVFQTGVTGDKKYSGKAYITSLELTSDGNDTAVTFSYEMEGNGAIAEGTVS